MQNPYMEALAQGGSVANQGMANASKMLDSVANIFNSSGSLALKMNMLLEQEEARKQQELLQTAQFMHQVQQDEFMNKYRQDDLNFRREDLNFRRKNAEALMKYRYDDLNFREKDANRNYDLNKDKLNTKKIELLLKDGQDQYKIAQKLYGKLYKLVTEKNNVLARISVIDKELNSGNLTIEQRNALLQQKQALQNNIALYDGQIKNIQSQFNPQNQNFSLLNQNQQNIPTLASYNQSQQPTHPVGSNTGSNTNGYKTINLNVTNVPSVFNQQIPDIETYNNSAYVTKNGEPITLVDNSGKVIEGNLKKVLKDMPESTQQTFLIHLYKNLSDNLNFDTGGIANVLPKTQNTINSLAKHIKDDKARKTFIATAYIDLADKIGNYPGISDIDKYKFGLKIANQFNNPKVLDEVSSRLGLPVKSTYILSNYTNENIEHIYRMLNDQGWVSKAFEDGFHWIGWNSYDVDGTPVTYSSMRTALYQTIKELSKEKYKKISKDGHEEVYGNGYRDYNIALALERAKAFSDNNFYDSLKRKWQIAWYDIPDSLAKIIVNKIDLPEYKPKVHLTEYQRGAYLTKYQRAPNPIEERMTLGDLGKIKSYKENINTDPTMKKIKQILSTEDIELNKDYELPVLVYGKPVTIKVKGEDIIDVFVTDVFLPKLKDVIKDSKLESAEIFNKKYLNGINKWTNE